MYARKYERPITGVSQAAYQRLFSHAWPGNVRELQNVIERAVLLAKDKQIEPIDLPFDNGTVPEGASANVQWDVPPNMTLEDIERLVIERTLQRTGGNKQAAANLVGYLPAAPVQQDQKIQYRCAVTGVRVSDNRFRSSPNVYPLICPSNSIRLRGVDALRGMAALGIVLYHADRPDQSRTPKQFALLPGAVGPTRHLANIHQRLSVFRDLRFLYSPAMGAGSGRW